MLYTRILHSEYNIISLLLALLLILSTNNILGNIVDSQRYATLLLISYIIIVFLLFFYVFYGNRLSRMLFSPIDYLIVLILFYILLKNIIASSLTIVSHISCILLYCHIRFTNKLNYIIIYMGVLFACFILSTYGYLQYLELIDVRNSYFQITGPFSNPAPYGGMLGFFILVIAVVFFIQRVERGKIDYFSLSILIFSFPVFILSNSRAAWLALIVSLFFVFSHQYAEQLKKFSFRLKFIGVIASILVALLICIGLFILRPDSAKGRILIWKVSFDMIFDKPILGLGYGGVEANYMHYQEKYFKNSNSTKDEQYLAGNNHSTFNEPLRFWIEYGVVGFMLYLLLVYLILFKTKTEGVTPTAAKALLIMFFIFGLLSYPCRIFQHKLICIIALAILMNHQKQFAVYLSNKALKIITLGSIIILIALLATLIKQHLLYYRCNESIFAYYRKENKDILNDLERFESAMPQNNLLLMYYSYIALQEGDDSLFFQKLTQCAALHPTNRLYIRRGDYLRSQNQHRLAEKEYWKAHYMIPSQQKARTHIALLYAETGRMNEAKELALELLNEKVKVYGFETFELHEKLEKIIKQ